MHVGLSSTSLVGLLIYLIGFINVTLSVRQQIKGRPTHNTDHLNFTAGLLTCVSMYMFSHYTEVKVVRWHFISFNSATFIFQM